MARARFTSTGDGSVWIDALDDGAGNLVALVAHNAASAPLRITINDAGFLVPPYILNEVTLLAPAGTAWPGTISIS